MHITMVKKRLENGDACDKCIQAEELLKSKGHWDKIHEVLWAIDGDPNSPGMALAAAKGVKHAPFFVVRDATGSERVYVSVLKFIKECLSSTADGPRSVPSASNADVPSTPPRPLSESDVEGFEEALLEQAPEEVVHWALDRYGAACAIAFSGAEDVILIDWAKKSGKPFSVFCLDTGRLHPETYEFIERVRTHYSIEIQLFSPDPALLQDFVRSKGLFNFYEDGHKECCAIRKVEPLGRALRQYRAWITGQRRDQSPTRSLMPLVQLDEAHRGTSGPLLKLNPLLDWSLSDVWRYLVEQGVPYNVLHDRGFVSIGCAPCTRPVRPGEHERAGRWWWEDATRRECGLHVR
jgi:phosphoadenosine phosphosulfate reductase